MSHVLWFCVIKDHEQETLLNISDLYTQMDSNACLINVDDKQFSDGQLELRISVKMD